MKKIILWFIRRYADDRDFRISICKELHENAQNYYGEQTGYGRFYEACEEFFLASRFTKLIDNTSGISATFVDAHKKLSQLNTK